MSYVMCLLCQGSLYPGFDIMVRRVSSFYSVACTPSNVLQSCCQPCVVWCQSSNRINDLSSAYSLSLLMVIVHEPRI